MNMNNERTIVIKDLLFWILSKWRAVVWCMIVFALILESITGIKTYISALSEKSTQGQLIDLNQYKENLTSNQIEVTENAYSTYMQYKKEFEKLEQYCNNAPRMQIDYTKTPSVNLLYKVYNCDNMPGLISFIYSDILNQKWCENAVNKMNWNDVPYEYIPDLIGIYDVNEQMQNSNQIVVDTSTDEGMMEIVKIRIIAPDKDSAKELATLVKEELKDKLSRIQKQYKQISMTLISDKFVYELNNDLFSSQKSNMDNMANIHTAINSLTSNFDDNQKSYYQALIDNEIIKQNEDSIKNNEEKMPSILHYISFKYIIIGMIAGAFLMCCYLTIVYLLNKNLRTSIELTDDFNIPLLGEVALDTNKNGIDALIYHFIKKENTDFSNKNRIDMICAGIKIAVDKKNMQSIHISGASNSKEVIDFKEKLSYLLMDDSIKITIGSSVAYDSSSLKMLSVTDGAVFIEQINESKISDIENELQVCNKYGVPIIGAIVLK